MKLTTIAAALLLTGSALPAIAQSESEPAVSDPNVETTTSADAAAGVAEMMKGLFKVEPLTAEQKARLPQAEGVIARIMPPGTLQQVMGGMFEKFFDPIMALGGQISSSDAVAELDVLDDEFAMSDEDAARVVTIIDPARAQRVQIVADATKRATSAAMVEMEPAMRRGMAEAYAATFSTAELTAVDRFFATPEGGAFARKSYALASDPRIMAAAMENLPAMITRMSAMEAETKAATDALPKRRGYADLSAAERAEIATLTGLDQDAIREGMERAAQAREAIENDGEIEGDDVGDES